MYHFNDIVNIIIQRIFTEQVQEAMVINDSQDESTAERHLRRLLSKVYEMMEREKSLRLQRDKFIKIALVRKGLLSQLQTNEFMHGVITAKLGVYEERSMSLIENENLENYQHLEFE